MANGSLLEGVGNTTIGQDRQPFCGDGRARDVADQVLKAIGTALANAHGGMQAEAVDVGGPGELERALREPKRAVATDAGGNVLAVAFCPRASWARCFRFFPLYGDLEW